MAQIRGTILLLLLVVVAGCVPPTMAEVARTGPLCGTAGLSACSVALQIPNLLRQIVEAVQKAVEELDDSLREQLCSRCPASIGVLLLSVLWALRHEPTARR